MYSMLIIKVKEIIKLRGVMGGFGGSGPRMNQRKAREGDK